jgi:enoyl-CoA hydratase/carnithine racemase
MTDAKILSEVRGAVLIVTINRPERRNAICAETAHEIERAWDRLDSDSALRAGIITGAGGVFSAGADLKAAAAGLPPARTAKRGFFGTIGQPPQKPVLAAVEGDALGGGFELALACDLIIASQTARFGLPECRRGVLAAAGGAARLPAKIPVNVAMEMLLTGAPQHAARLHALGLINMLCAPGDALAAAMDIANEVAGNAPLAVAAARRVVREVVAGGAAAGWARQEAEWEVLRGSADYREGIAAFAEKRQPQWRGE